MATTKKPKFPTIYSPPGIGKYCWLTKPDSYQGKEKYKATLLMLDNDKVREWCDSMEALAKKTAAEHKIKLKKNFKIPFKFPEDADEDDFIPQEGHERAKLDEDYRERIYFTATSDYPPGVIGTVKDETGAFMELPEGTFIMSGDDIRLKLQVVPYEGLGSGYTFRVQGAQLLKKRSGYTKGNAGAGWDELPDGYGDDEEEGYEGDPSEDIDDEIPF